MRSRTRPDAQRLALCVALTREGAIIQERWFAPGEPVTVGRSRRASLRLDAPDAPRRVLLFEGRRDGHALRTCEGLRGRLNLEDGSISVADLDTRNPLPLPPASRGRLAIGDAVLLFKVAPERLAASALPRSFRAPGLLEDEPVLVTFLTGFSAIAAVLMAGMYTMKPVLDTTIADMPEIEVAFIELPAPKVEVAVTQPAKAQAVPGKVARRDSAEKPGPIRRTVEQAVAEDSALLRMLAARNADNGIFSDDSAVLRRLQAGLDNTHSFDVASLTAGPMTSTVRATEATIDALATAGGDETTVGSGPRNKLRESSFAKAIEQDPAWGKELSGVLAGYAGSIKACFDRSLSANPHLSGRLTIVLTAAAGRVYSVETSENGTGDERLASCAEGAARRWRLPPNTDGQIEIPYILSTE